MLTRSSHVATSSSLIPGIEEVTLFGGSSTFAPGVALGLIPKMANTTLLIFGNDEIIPYGVNFDHYQQYHGCRTIGFRVDTSGCGEF